MKNNRRQFLKSAMTMVGASAFASTIACSRKSQQAKNALFIIVEDLKNIMGCYGNPIVRTPNIDRLAQKGVIFDSAYCQYPVCNPSRSSFLTGLRPDTTKILENVTPWTTTVKNHTTLPRMFKNNGYYTAGMGKVFHGKDEHDDAEAWDDYWKFTPTPVGKQGESRNMTNGSVKWCSWLAAEGTDEDQPDGQIAAQAVEVLQTRGDKPFFMVLGFEKPHDPFNAPKKYFDLYPLEKLMPPVMPENRTPKEDFVIGSGWAQDFKKFTLQDKREFLRSYYACTTFTDAQIGKVLDELDRQDLWADTMVVFIGDHGYNLGEYDWWNKAVLFEDSARVPMIVVADGETKPNTRCSEFVELVDLYPTFADIFGLQPPANLEGISFRPLFSNPAKPWKQAAYTQVQRGDIAGKSVRTKRWRYNEWTRDGKIILTELFDHTNDPKEYYNLAQKAEYRETCLHLSEMLSTGHNKLNA
jgi:uncharacterized sulfatase